ncbi:MAG: cytochrome P450 [Chloroflexi bacterium]|nr:cytochrome P450 [Chloroflexota bacterium]
MATHASPTATPSAPFDPSAFNLFAPDQLANPFPTYAQARRDQPVFYSPMFDMWFVTRYEDITTVVKQPHLFSSAEALESTDRLPEPVIELLKKGYLKFQSLVQTDPPEHSRVRAVFGKVLTPQRVAALEPGIRELTNQLIDAFVADGEADLIPQFAFSLPALTICDLLGVPRSDIDRVQRGNNGRQTLMGANSPVEVLIAAAHDYLEYQHYFIEQLERRVHEPQDDLLTLLVPAEIGGSAPLSLQEAVCNAIDLFAAGHETTTAMIGNGMSLLLDHPEQMQALREHSELLPNAIEEILRMEAPVRGLFRVTTSETMLGDTQLPQGARMLMMYGSANRDERQFADPDIFDIRRKDANKHVAFGKGMHFCIGSVLAKLEGRVAFELLLKRLPNLRRHPERPAVRRPNLILHCFDHFPIAWDREPAA